MNHYGQRFGGQPQPQRQGGRRGNRGGYRNSRFDQGPAQNAPRNQPNNQQSTPPKPAEVKQDKPPQTPPVVKTPEVPKTVVTKPEPATPQPAQKVEPTPQANTNGVHNKPSPNNFNKEAQPSNQQANFNKGSQQGLNQQGNFNKGSQQGSNQQGSFNKGSQQGLNQQGSNQQGNFNKDSQQGNLNKGPQQGNLNKGPQQGLNQQGNFNKDSQPGNFNKGPQQGFNQQGNFNRGSQQELDQQGNVNKGSQQNLNQSQDNKQGNFGPGNREDRGSFGNRGGREGGNFGNRGGRDGSFNNRQGGGPQGGRPNQTPGQGGRPGGPGGPPRNQRGGGRQGGEGGPHGRMPEEQLLANKLKDLVGPLIDLAPLDTSEVKFNGRSRLYVGNLTQDTTEEELAELFKPFGETNEVFVNKEKGFAFIRMDYRANAEKAKRELDGVNRKGRSLRVRFAPHNSAVRVRNLPSFVSNELLYKAFEIFGKIERAYVKVDERGKTLGEGVVEYARKPSAMAALRNCTEKCFFLTSSLRPVIVESFEEPDELDGYQEKNLPKKNPEFLRSREVGPRFSEAGSFEHEYGTRWKQLHELQKQKEEALKTERAAEEEKLEAQMEFAKYEHETEMLRAQLRQREQDRERQKRSWELAERAAEERREQDRAALLRQEEDLSQRMRLQDDELRRRQQENTLFVQAQRLNSMLDRQEQGMFDAHPAQSPMEGGGYADQFDNAGRGYDDMMGSNSRWEQQRHSGEEYPSKRRRF